MTSEPSGVATVETRDGFAIGPAPVGDAVGRRLSKSGKPIGRPPGSKTGSGKSAPSRPVSSPGAGGTAASDTLERERAACSTFVEMAMLVFVSSDEFLKRAILVKVRAYVTDDNRYREFELEVFNRYCVTEADKTYLRGVLLALALKYPLLRKIGPEISLLVFLARYGAQHVQLMRQVELLKPQRAPVRVAPPPPTTEAKPA